MPIMPSSQMRSAWSGEVASPALSRSAASRAAWRPAAQRSSSQAAKSSAAGRVRGAGVWSRAWSVCGSRLILPDAADKPNALSPARTSAGCPRVAGVPDPDRSEDLMIEARDLRKSFGDFEAVRGIDLAVRKGEAFGFLGPERRRQVLDHADDRRRLAGQWRRAPDPRPRPGEGRSGHPRPARRLPAGGHPRHRAQRLRQPLHLRPVLRDPGRRRPRAGARSCWSSSSSPRRRSPRSRTSPAA